MAKKYNVVTVRRTAQPRSKRLREAGVSVSGVSSVSVGSSGSVGGDSSNCDGHSHANKAVLDALSMDEGYLYLRDKAAEADDSSVEKVKAGYADEAGLVDEATHAASADEATHAASADEATHAASADEADHAAKADYADDSDKWDGRHFSSYLDQAVKTGSDVTHNSLTATQGVSAKTLTATEGVTAASATISGKVTAESVEANGAVKGNTVEATTSVSGKTVTASESVSTKTLTASGNATIKGDATISGDTSTKNLTASADVSAKNVKATSDVSADTATIATKVSTKDVEASGEVSATDVEASNSVSAKTVAASESVTAEKFATANFTNSLTAIGEGAGVLKEGNRYNAYFDNVYVREGLHAITLVNEKLNTVSLGLLISRAHGTVASARNTGSEIQIVLQDKDMQFQEGDYVRWSAVDFSANSYEQRAGWLYLREISGRTLILDNVDGSSTAGITPPQEGDTVVLCGSEDEARQAVMLLTVSDNVGPRIVLYDGVDDTTLEGREKATLGDLEGINDSDFGALQGYGLYAQSAYLKGVLKVIAKDGLLVTDENGNRQTLSDYIKSTATFEVTDDQILGVVEGKNGLNGKLSEFKQTVDGISKAVFDENGESKITQTASEIKSMITDENGESLITQNADKIEAIVGEKGSLTILKQTVDGISKAVFDENGESKITQTASEIKSMITDENGESLITQNADKIEAIVGKEGSLTKLTATVDGIEGRVQSVEKDYVSQSTLTTTANSITAKVEAAVVRPNLLQGTADCRDNFGYTTDGEFYTEAAKDGYFAQINTPGTYNVVYHKGVGADTLVEGEIYTLSFEAAFDSPSGTVEVYVSDTTSKNIVCPRKSITINEDGNYHRYEMTFAAAEMNSLDSSCVMISLAGIKAVGVSVRIRHLKLEHGDFATDWTTGAADAAYNTTQIKINAEGITQQTEEYNALSESVATIKTTAEGVQTSVTKIERGELTDNLKSAVTNIAADAITSEVKDDNGEYKWVNKIEQTSSSLTSTITKETERAQKAEKDNATAAKDAASAASANAASISKITQTVAGISVKVRTFADTADNLYLYPHTLSYASNKEWSSNGGYFTGGNMQLSQGITKGTTVTVRMVGKFGTGRISLFCGTWSTLGFNLWSSKAPGHEEDYDYVGGVEHEQVTYTFEWPCSDATGTLFAIRTADTDGDSVSIVNAECYLEYVAVCIGEGAGVGTMLKDSGIDVIGGKTTVTSDNFVVQNNSGEQTMLVDANGQLTTSLIDADALTVRNIAVGTTVNNSAVLINADGTINANIIDVAELAAQKLYAMIAGQNTPVFSINAEGDGANKFYWPGTTQVMLQILPMDSEGESVIQFFDTDGTELWHIGKKAAFVASGSFSWETILLAELTATEAASATNYGNTSSAYKAYRFHASSDNVYATYNGRFYTDNTRSPNTGFYLESGTYYAANYTGGVPNAQGLPSPKRRAYYVIGDDGVLTDSGTISVG